MNNIIRDIARNTTGTIAKNKILFRLISYFVTSFIVFALIIGVLFTVIFSSHNTAEHTSVQQARTTNTANLLSEMLSENVAGDAVAGNMIGDNAIGGNTVGGNAISGNAIGGIAISGDALYGNTDRNAIYGVFMQYIEDSSADELWVVDSNLKQISFIGSDQAVQLNKERPDWATDTVLRAINEKSLVTKIFNDFSASPGIITSAPITLRDGVVGAVIIYSPRSDVHHITDNGVMILAISMLASVFISILVAFMLSSRFTKPLGKMKQAALLMSGGDYTAKTGVMQNDEIGELAAIMDDMADKLEEASQERIKLYKLRRDYVANISHELRTPVTVIRGSLEALCDGVVSDSEKVAEYNKQMLTESIYLERLVSDILDLARLQNLDFTFEIDEVDLKDVAEDVVRCMRHIAEQKTVSLVFTHDGDDFFTMGDYARLRQMLIIVLDNAIKFSPEGGTVGVRLLKSETDTQICIQDNGCGISPDDLPNIFERFYKQRSDENKTGTGLGLAIAKQIADRHMVTVDVTSSQSIGTKFVFSFHSIDRNRGQR